MPIRRIGPDNWPRFCHVYADSLQANGLPYLQDQNAEFGDGMFPAAFSNIDDRRVSTAAGYLDAATRARPNLHIHAGMQVERIVMANGRAVGVAAIDARGNRVRFDAGEVIVSAGALQSPVLLLHAGIGDASVLDRLGVPVTADRPGVGRNLQDHPSLTFCHFLAPEFRMPLARRRASMTAARFSSKLPGCDVSDMYMSSATRAAWHALGNRLGLFFLWCNRPYSRGHVRIVSPDPQVAPDIELNLLSDERDLQRMATGVRVLAEVVQGSALHRHPGDFFPAAFSPRVKALSRVTPANKLLTQVLGAALDVPAPLRRWMIERFVTGGQRMAALLATRRRCMPSSARACSASGMPAAPAAWARPATALAVTDAEGRVHGVREPARGRRLADAEPALGEHQHSHHHDGRKNCRRDPLAPAQRHASTAGASRRWPQIPEAAQEQRRNDQSAIRPTAPTGAGATHIPRRRKWLWQQMKMHSRTGKATATRSGR